MQPQLQRHQAFSIAGITVRTSNCENEPHSARMSKVQIVFRGRIPGQVQDKFEVCACYVVIGRAGWETLEASQFPLEFFFSFFRQVCVFEPLTQHLDFRFVGIFVAQFLLDGAQLLAQQILALLLAHLVACARGDLLPELQYLHFVREIGVDQAERVYAGFRFEKLLLACCIQAEYACQQVGQPQRIFASSEHPRQLGRSLRLRERDRLVGEIQQSAG